MTDTRFPGTARLRKRGEFDAVFAQARAASNRYFRVLARSNELDRARLGLAVSKKVARRAVDRNAIKRIVRESFRHRADVLGGWDFVVLPRPEARAADAQQLRLAIDPLWQQAIARRATRGKR